MMVRAQFLLFLLMLLLGSCIQPSTNRILASSEDSTDDEVEESTEIYWYSSEATSYNVTINDDTEDVIQMRGGAVEYFLADDDNYYIDEDSSETKIYCMVVNFNYSGAKKQLRARAIPLLSGSKMVFRIDLPETAINALTCSGSVTQTITVLGVSSSTTVSSSTDIAYSPDEVCTTCSGEITATSIDFYQSVDGSISNDTQIEKSVLDLDTLDFRLDTSSSTTSATGSCTNSECTAKGYDCCLDGQCVYDGYEKSNADEDDDYLQALASVANNPLNYILWPNIYYICGNTPQVTATPTATPDVDATSDAYLAEQIADYNCLQGAEEDTPDYSACVPDGDYASYIAVRNDVWDRCGCEADEDSETPFDPESACPDFGLEPVYDDDDSTTIIGIVCDIPSTETTPTPFKDTSTTVLSRMAPHRFFATDGEEYPDIEDIVDSDIVQEGEEFLYLDTVNYTEPQTGEFNMNTVLGSMKVDLSAAYPARVINVDYESPYIITAIKGSYHTPCSICTEDGWNSLFSAFPATSNGIGLQAIGHTTSRVITGTNSSHGNYEDTLFGRACWVPPTMIPFSHSKYSSVEAQREHRLETQAAMFINGYQRDWYGFNKNAIIGSFDGVTWFAIGHGRTVVSTSTKLFLAINAPFADLAETSNTTVTIVADNGYNGGTDYDYDPDQDPNSSSQNQGASCQQYHYCETDIDCVTQLGWEYTCGDVSKYKSHMPRFDLAADEIADDQITSAKFTNSNELLVAFPYSQGTKRCVYRGAGAPCAIDYSEIANAELQKLFTCAPNFYCAGLDENEFNSSVVRTPDQIEGITISQEADILGRPKKYIGASDSLNANIKANIRDNAENLGISTSNIGLCRPGKRIDTPVDLLQHQSKDSQMRTDYISQISSCDSTATGRTRVQTCPIFDMDDDEDNDDYGNYIRPTSSDYTDYLDTHVNQNSCGASSIYSSTSTFIDIELDPISSFAELSTPSVARDACLRKAGSPCHTNYDCGPNEIYSDSALYFDVEYFGNTQAEKDYWSQYLVCGQGEDEPTLYADNYYNYDLKKNRCCREVTKEFTMYTEGFDTVLSDPEYADENQNLDADLLPSYGNSNKTGRYSRYEVVAPLNSSEPTVTGTPVHQTPKVSAGTAPYAFQWKTLNDTARKTCCGGGWVRKFADGTHDWTIRNRNIFVLSSFKCLNYSTDLYRADEDTLTDHGINPNNYDRDQERLCQSPVDEDQDTLYPLPGTNGWIRDVDERAGGGCIHAEMASVDKFEIIYPTDYSPANIVVLDTMLYYDDSTGLPTYILYPEVPYAPVPYDSDENYLKQSTTGTPEVSFYLPGYLDRSSIGGYAGSHNVTALAWTDSDGSTTENSGDSYNSYTLSPNNVAPANDTSSNECNALLGDGEYCIEEINGYTVFRAKLTLAAAEVWAGIRIPFVPYTTNTSSNQNQPSNSGGMVPGNVMFYQTKLARFELLGIPQIFYEPLYCNDDKSKLVPDIFNPDYEDQDAFKASGYSYPYDGPRASLAAIYDQESGHSSASTDNSDEYITTQQDVALAAVFMPNDFLCCRELGSVVTNANQCCSGYAISESSELICKLPRGTDLNVYFNRFVSGDGTGSDQPGGGLEDDDFIPETGEIKLETDAYDKLVQLGTEYCENGSVRTGGAFGNFYPADTFYHYLDSYTDDDRLTLLSIVDEASDYDDSSSTSPRGYYDFQIGFRWNHHYYCD